MDAGFCISTLVFVLYFANNLKLFLDEVVDDDGFEMGRCNFIRNLTEVRGTFIKGYCRY